MKIIAIAVSLLKIIVGLILVGIALRGTQLLWGYLHLESESVGVYRRKLQDLWEIADASIFYGLMAVAGAILLASVKEKIK